MSYNPNGYNPYNGYNQYPPVLPTGGYPMPPPMGVPMYNQTPMAMGYGAYSPYYQRPMYYNEGNLV